MALPRDILQVGLIMVSHELLHNENISTHLKKELMLISDHIYY
jgi:hypothetical protein